MIVLNASALVDVVPTRAPNRGSSTGSAARPSRLSSHQPAEVLSALARLVRAGELPSTAARDAVLELAALEQELVPATADHLTRALELQDRVRVLDGLYVALAEERGVPLVTTDQRLAGSNPPVVVEAP